MSSLSSMESYRTGYRGRRRWNGNWGMLWIDNDPVFEHKLFEVKVIGDREDVIIGNSKDSKVTSLKGEGNFTILKVFNRGLSKLLEEWKKGHDPRCKVTATHADPDMIDAQQEEIAIDNVGFDEIEMMKFEKGSVTETEISFHFTPEDAKWTNTVEKKG